MRNSVPSAALMWLVGRTGGPTTLGWCPMVPDSCAVAPREYHKRLTLLPSHRVQPGTQDFRGTQTAVMATGIPVTNSATLSAAFIQGSAAIRMTIAAIPFRTDNSPIATRNLSAWTSG